MNPALTPLPAAGPPLPPGSDHAGRVYRCIMTAKLRQYGIRLPPAPPCPAPHRLVLFPDLARHCRPGSAGSPRKAAPSHRRFPIRWPPFRPPGAVRRPPLSTSPPQRPPVREYRHQDPLPLHGIAQRIHPLPVVPAECESTPPSPRLGTNRASTPPDTPPSSPPTRRLENRTIHSGRRNSCRGRSLNFQTAVSISRLAIRVPAD